MLYPKNKAKELTDELFKNPTAEYRATPFWAWNSNLDKPELFRQIEVFKKMGFGGFHMHVRQGLTVEYLGEEFLSAISACTEKAESLDMLAWLYDEDRWPSGVAGGIVTKTKKYRQKFLTMTVTDREDCAQSLEQAAETGKPFFIGAFSVQIDKDGKMTAFTPVDRFSNCQNKRLFFVEQQQGGEPRYNYQSYVDTLDKTAIDEFIKVTHEKLKNTVGDKFGKTIPAIFTDEPLFMANVAPASGFDTKDVKFAWTTDFAKTYKSTFGSDLTEVLPELFFATDLDSAKQTRYNYYTHLSERFNNAYMDNIGKWCEDNGIALTGHLMGEDTLYEQVLSNGDAMRAYKNMQIPGIDLLFNDCDFNTAIQCRSVVRQLGKEAMLSELYGVTGWDFDFRGHKFQGDWQACLGVTVRVPHLAWQSMKGEGKRDYPAPISYQSPWHEQYSFIEDHFARINTALTRGNPIVNLAVLHPIDSYKTVYSSLAETADIRDELEDNFRETTDWLLSLGYDFDFISESLLPDLCADGGYPLCVGKMKYDAVILSDCTTLRPHTIKVLEQFKSAGGKVIVMGRVPYMSLGVMSDAAKNVLNGATVIMRSKEQLRQAINHLPKITVKNLSSSKDSGLMFTLRQDGNYKWLFGANMRKQTFPHEISRRDLAITLDGCYTPTLYDTLSGDKKELSFKTSNNSTTFYITVYDLDSILVKLSPAKPNLNMTFTENKQDFVELKTPFEVNYSLSEPNVLLLDTAFYSADGKDFVGPEEIMRIDAEVRKEFNLQSRRTKVVQPWAVKDSPEDHKVSLIFHVNSDIDYSGALLALEHPNTCDIRFNGQVVDNTAVGYYVDMDIKTVKLPDIKCGLNVLQISMPFGLRTDLESCYIIGKFGTNCVGRNTKIVNAEDKLCFGDVTRQGLFFYGGNIEYVQPIDLDFDGDLEVTVSHYRGAVIQVLFDGNEVGKIAFSPYKLKIKNAKKGSHEIKYILNGTRYNTFSALHNLNADKSHVYMGPDFWRSENDAWAYEYFVRPMGILKAPIVKIAKN